MGYTVYCHILRSFTVKPTDVFSPVFAALSPRFCIRQCSINVSLFICYRFYILLLCWRTWTRQLVAFLALYKGWRTTRCAIFPSRYVNGVAATPTLERDWCKRSRALRSDWPGEAPLSPAVCFLVVAVKHTEVWIPTDVSVAALHRPERLLINHETRNPVSGNVCCVSELLSDFFKVFKPPFFWE